MPSKDPSSNIKAALRAHQESADPLEKLKWSQRIREAADELERRAIEEAREHGITWRDIGACYGLSKQGAQQRFNVALQHRSKSGHKK